MTGMRHGWGGKLAPAAFIVVLLGVLVAALSWLGPDVPFISDPAAAGIASGQTVYQSRCATCHGQNLEGQPDWQTPLSSGRLPAPPHDKTGHTWHHPDDVLIGITKQGIVPYAPEGYESDMPAFGGILTDAEIAAAWAYIKSTWPERERDYQERMTRQKQAQETAQ